MITLEHLVHFLIREDPVHTDRKERNALRDPECQYGKNNHQRQADILTAEHFGRQKSDDDRKDTANGKFTGFQEKTNTRWFSAKQVEKLCQHAFRRAVGPGNDAGLLERLSGCVEVHVDGAVQALGDIHYYFTQPPGFPDDVQEPVLRRGVPRAVCLKDDSAGIFAAQDVPNYPGSDAGMYLKDRNPGVEGSAGHYAGIPVSGSADEGRVIFDIDSGLGQGREIG